MAHRANTGSATTTGGKQAGGICRDHDKKLASDLIAVGQEYVKDFEDRTKGLGIPMKPWDDGASNLDAIQAKFGKGAGVD